jgi:hypothetical protein
MLAQFEGVMIPVDSGPWETAAAVKCDLASEVLRSFGKLRFAATGWSMLPTVWPGDTLVVERVSPDQVKVGEVVLVGREGRLCAHRVVSTAQSSGIPGSVRPRIITPHFVTRGDAMPSLDRPVSQNDVLGRVTHRIRAGKLVALPAELSGVAKVVARIVRRSVPAARALVCLHGMLQTPEKSESSNSGESVLPCQG